MPKGLARQWVIKQALFPQVVDVENERRGIRRDYSDWSSVKLLDSALFASWRENIAFGITLLFSELFWLVNSHFAFEMGPFEKLG